MTHPQPNSPDFQGPKPIRMLIEKVLANYPILSQRPPIDGEAAWFGEIPDENDQAFHDERFASEFASENPSNEFVLIY